MRSNPQRLRRFAANEDGNIAILFGFLALMLFGFIGAAVDYARFNAVKSDIIESMDAAGLAIAQLSALDDELTADELEEYGRKFFHENFRYDNLIENLDVEFLITSAKIIPTVNGTMKTKMLRVGFFETFDMTSSTEITRKGSGQIELALVLDVTGSMSGTAGGEVKIESLRTAVDTLLQVMFGEETTSDNLKISVVPFNAVVNPGAAASWSDSYNDEIGEAYYHGAHFFHVDENGLIDMDRTVNQFDLFNSVPNAEWNGCVEARPYPLDELDIPPSIAASSSEITDALMVPPELSSPSGDDEERMADAFADAPATSLAMGDLTSAVNTKWVPLFVPDEPDCNSSYECEYNKNGWVGAYNWYGYWFDDPDNDSIYTDHKESDYWNRYFINDREYTKYNMGTPFQKYVPIVYHFREVLRGNINDPAFEEFLDKISATSYGEHEYILRNSYVGWWDPGSQVYEYKYDQNPSIDESISDTDSSMRGPNDDCPAPVLPLTNDRTDVETHMDTLFPNGYTNSANGALWGWRTLSPGAPFDEGAEYDDGDWQKAVVIMTDGQNTVKTLENHWGSNMSAYGYALEERMGLNLDKAWEMRDEIDNKLLRICHRMKEQGILVYTIVFGLDDDDLEQVFKSCATSSIAPYYQKAPSGAELETAFGDIAQDLVKLHISK